MEKQSNRKLPEIDVAGIKFYADATHSELIEAGNPDNRISILEMMTFEDHHEFLFNLETKNVAHGRWNIPADELGEHLTWVWIRPIGAIDPEGMAQLVKEGKIPALTLAELSQPIISIANTSFYVDELHGRFRELTNRWNYIDFKDVQQGELNGFYFDTNVKNIPFPHELDADTPIEKLPGHIVFAKVPTGEELSAIIKRAKKSLQDNKPYQHRKEHNRHRKGQKF